MLRTLGTLMGFHLICRDGRIGTVKDAYFDDEHWHLRYLVVDTGDWLPERKVLIPIASLGIPRWKDGELPVGRTTAEIESAPQIGADAPVSRRIERLLLEHYDWAAYWGGPLDPTLTPAAVRIDGPTRETIESIEEECHLRSAQEIQGYRIEAKDGEIGHVDDLVAESERWDLRYLVIKLSEWLPGHRVLFALPWVQKISYLERHLTVDASVELVKESPRFDPKQAIDPEVEVSLFRHYDRIMPWL